MSEWISVEDMLPNDLDGVDILINAQRRVTDCTYTHGKFYTHQFKQEYWTEVKNNVTHWMPLPSPPQPTNLIDSFIASGGFDKAMGCKNGE